MKTITSFYKSPIGPIEIVCTNDKIQSISLKSKSTKSVDNDLTKLVKRNLKSYFNGELSSASSLPIKYFNLNQGTPFQIKVWKQLTKIKASKTLTYKDISLKVNSPKAMRAVGGAVGKNPFLIFFPCHRVLGQNKKIIGFSAGIDNKKFLLNLEFIPYIN